MSEGAGKKEALTQEAAAAAPAAAAPESKPASPPGVPAASVWVTDEKGRKLFSLAECMLLRTRPQDQDNEQKKKEEQTPDGATPLPALYVGVVKNWFESGYGFIVTAGFDSDVFVHWKDLVIRGFKKLHAGDVVVYEKAKNKDGKPVAKQVRCISALHLAYSKPFLHNTKPGTRITENIELIEHPKPEKREFAPLKARMVGGSVEFGSLRKMVGNRLYLLLNRNKVRFTGAPNPSYSTWEELREHVPEIMQQTSIALGPKIDLKPTHTSRGSGRTLGTKKQKQLDEYKQLIRDHMNLTKSHARSTRISKLRDILPKAKFNPKHFGFEKFKNFLESIPEIEFLNENKIQLRGRGAMNKKRKREGDENKNGVVKEEKKTNNNDTPNPANAETKTESAAAGSETAKRQKA